MAVDRYRSVEHMPEPPQAISALEGLAAARASSVMSRAFGHTSRAHRGVRRFRSIEEADRHRQQWESAVSRGASPARRAGGQHELGEDQRRGCGAERAEGGGAEGGPLA